MWNTGISDHKWYFTLVQKKLKKVKKKLDTYSILVVYLGMKINKKRNVL